MKTIKAMLVCLLALAIAAPLSSCVLFKRGESQELGQSELKEPEDKTYVIRTVEDLFGLPEYINRHLLDTEVVVLLENDVTVNPIDDFSEWVMSAEKREKLINWTPVKYFTGTFDGQGHTLSGIYCSVDGSEEKYLESSLFYSIYEGATVKNLNVTDSLFYSAEGRTTAVIAAFNSGTVKNCHTRAQVYSDAMYVSLLVGRTDDGGRVESCTSAGVGINTESGNQTYLAGICSSLGTGSTIIDCVNYADLHGTSGVYIGGIVAAASGTIKGCSNYGNIENEGNETGGITARLTNDNEALIEYCVNYGSVTNRNKNWGIVAGIVARMESGTVRCSENRGTVVAADGGGGICGATREESSVFDCLNLGEIIGYDNGDIWDNMFGGIAGTQYGGIIERCCNAGLVNSEEVAGGIVGGETSGEALILKCWNFGKSIGGKFAGGIVGDDMITGVDIESCYNYGKQEAPITFDFCDTRNGVGPMNCYSEQSQGYEESISVSDFDFETVWNAPADGVRYPTLRNMPVHAPTSPLA